MFKRLGSKRRRLAAVAVVSAAVVLGAGYAYGAITATNNQYTGCLQLGIVFNVAIGAAPAHACPRGATQISWSQSGPQGLPGTNGTSVTSAAEAAGANCANGGSKFTAANGVTYACNGAKGDTGQTGAPGPSSLNALDGSPCTFSGNTSTTKVSVDSTTGAVSITCNPVYKLSFTATGGTMSHVDFRDQTIFANNNFSDVSSASVVEPAGESMFVELQSGDRSTGGGSPFTFTCNGGPPISAFSHGGSVSGTYYESAPQDCDASPLSGNYAVTASFSG